ncbi:hypothetical protein BDQ12DRAFT_676313 [Crucibulum laeve]|uniref:RRN6 K-rich C-terminal domain-containing protein n=1 Tax=Crucibulum laeve TaxID=68775 RepID=A0A5C3MC66_9AGAR|nr:hypothetical protein BDQ12DRAFT_676313 [Crucibulum laeve]
MPTQERRPPTVIASSSILPTPLEAGRRSAPIAQSQVPPVASRLRGFESQASQPSSMPQVSQDFMTNTQILPGPFGGRPTAAKKKPVKKRVGGF